MPSINKLVRESQELAKAPPGPPPRKGLVWHEATHRWRRPNAGGGVAGLPHPSSQRRVFPSSFVQVGGQLGTHPGGMYRDGAGRLSYIKWPGDARARVEVLAAELYQAAGLRVPVMKLVPLNGETAVQSEWLTNSTKLGFWDLEAIPEVRQGFVVDAWLANWDVIGMDSDNIVEYEGRYYRLDTGGALLYRTNGKPKEFGPAVMELDTMLDPTRAAETSQVFADLTMREMAEGAKAVAGVAEETIDSLVQSVGLPEGPITSYPGPGNIRTFLATRLKQRRAYIIRELLTEVSGLMRSMETYQEVNLLKAPPGPKPERFGDDVGWDDNRRRWVKDPTKGNVSEQQPPPEVEPQPRMGPVTSKVKWQEPLTQPGPKGTVRRMTKSGKIIPPGWRGVKINSNLKGNWQAIGVDAAGRTVALPSDDFVARNARVKFKRSRAFAKDLPKLRRQIMQDFDTSDEAKVLSVIDATSFRVGGGDSEVYGISTLRGKHVRVRGNMISFEFMGKKKQLNQKTIQNARLARLLRARKAQVGAEGQLFNTTDGQVRKYMNEKGFEEYSPKDFRTHSATQLARTTVKSMSVPRAEKDLKKAKQTVGQRVSEWLNNTPAVALGSYIDPSVFRTWERFIVKALQEDTEWDPAFDLQWEQYLAALPSEWEGTIVVEDTDE